MYAAQCGLHRLSTRAYVQARYPDCGGPGGLSTALHISRNFPPLASRVLVLEKARYPRSRLCAGGLVYDAEVILERLGLDVSEVPHVDVDRIHFDFETKGLSLRMPGDRLYASSAAMNSIPGWQKKQERGE